MKIITYIKEDEFSKILKAEKKKEFKLAYLLAFGSGSAGCWLLALGWLVAGWCLAVGCWLLLLASALGSY